ncbi:G-type lectin S-receptor-like serine/threonine-protein kinase At1g61480 isoform X6 [Malus sylvestris]|nr:G-type lectin S-receptor-like serine/threonine-protein kinase At1g61480 isoform X6 [Malus sylvestris]XP_050149323.1 G-type lectin S-receptor-like serine/threonine-protein kinase At1g61480 isoform X6 [Malus sylvestris]XP_050149324.1 G-type lectin S-receptor-like serine/threonine-protein kinase At1g61480 isoform X6 [Malus sylvestris]XP_050149325.1 G-type lectin S-receptor-like serine/threonine-protein kinase At1g61480 isoform X6 [Malus sylvestris]
MRNKRKCTTIVKGLHLFGDPSFLFFGAFVCSLQSCLCSHPMIAVSSWSRGKESTDSGSQLNSLQLNSEIVGLLRLIATWVIRKKKKGKEVTFWRRVRQYQTKIQNCSSTNLRLQCFDRCSEEGATTLIELLWHAQGQTLFSPSHIFELGFFSPNNSENKYVGIWHKNMFPRKVVWVANREKPLAVADALASLAINNGKLELVDGKQKSIWSINIPESSYSSAAVLLDTGNLVVADDRGAQLWKSFDYPGDTFLPGMLMGFDSQSGKQNVLTAWKNLNDSSRGLFLVELAPQIPAQIFVRINGSTPCWRSGPWDKSKFIGIPEMDDQYLSGHMVLDYEQQGAASFFCSSAYNKSLVYMDISSNGRLKTMVSEHGENWRINWEAQRTPCDYYGTCGPFGVCKVTDSLTTPICKCLKGFVPKSLEEWSKGNTTGGCVRKAKLFCESNTSQPVASGGKEDGFLKIESVNPPDFHEYILNMDFQGCRTQCQNNCSCLAYAFVTNIGCLIWSQDLLDIQQFSTGGVDLFIRLADAEFGEGKRTKLIVSLTSICFISIAAVVFGLHRLRAKQKGNIKVTTMRSELNDMTKNSRDTIEELIRKHDPSELKIYDLDSILIATSNFSINNKLGGGGFGPVYKGKLQEGKEIAVKRLSSSSGQGIEEFKNEVMLISKLQHKNLVRIMGCCIKDDEKLLIYEFMPNRSLDTLLFDPMRRGVLDWAKRFNIIQGVARGLLYLHHDSCLKVIHRDLKVSNILLDENMNPKISDFGLARIVQGTHNLENTQKVVGTLGYMSPEYAMRGIFSEKSDVYSFGVLLLEIIAGRKNTSSFYKEQELGILAYAWNLWNEGKGLDFVDEVLADSYSASEVTRCMDIGLLCVQNNAADRPTIADVVFMVRSETDRAQPKQPTFTFQNSLSDITMFGLQMKPLYHFSKDDSKREHAQLAEVPTQIYKSKSKHYLELSK